MEDPMEMRKIVEAHINCKMVVMVRVGSHGVLQLRCRFARLGTRITLRQGTRPLPSATLIPAPSTSSRRRWYAALATALRDAADRSGIIWPHWEGMSRSIARRS
jgi:hypothetical protein